MGMVVAAYHLELEERVALKFMREEMLFNRDAVERFLREARAAVRLKSEHICRVMDVGRLHTQSPYIVLEYLDGHDLATELHGRGPLPAGEVVDLLLQACEGMAEAHALGIVHRDLKPQNLFLCRRPDGLPLVKVLDFGVAKTHRSDAVSTYPGVTMGTPAYLSPEQWRSSKDVDARTDIYAIGVILFQLLTGQLPYDAAGLPEIYAKVMSDPVPALRSLRPELPVALDAVVRRCMAKLPDQRFHNVADLAAALMPFAPLRSHAALSLISKALEVPEPAIESPGTVSPPRSECPSIGPSSTLGRSVGQYIPTGRLASGRPWALRGGGALAALGLVALMLLRLANQRNAPEVPVAAPDGLDAGRPAVEVVASNVSDGGADAGVHGANDASDAQRSVPDASPRAPPPRPPVSTGQPKPRSKFVVETGSAPNAVRAPPLPPPGTGATGTDAATHEPLQRCDSDKDPSCSFRTQW
jgi:serine/threonine protein kinase